MARSSRTTLRRRFAESRLAFPLGALGVILLFDLIFEPGFFSLQIIDGHLYGSIVDVLRNGVPVMLLAIGMTLVIATGGIDLSVGAVMAISASVATLLINPDLRAFITDPGYSVTPLALVLVITLLVGLLSGLWNGVLVAYAGIQPMIATLILMIAGRGIAQLLTNGVRIQIFYDPYAFIGNGWVFLPFSLAIVVVFFTIAWVVTRMTSLGMFIESVGINARSSFFSGINEKRVKLFVYMFSGFCAAMAGIVASANIRTSDANEIGLNYELDAILAVVIGGTLLTGGRFSLLASVLGAIVMQSITTSMYALGVPANALLAVKGVVVIVVILLLSEQVRDGLRRTVALRPRAVRT
jgi:simple sugar transport system permease protein